MGTNSRKNQTIENQSKEGTAGFNSVGLGGADRWGRGSADDNVAG